MTSSDTQKSLCPKPEVKEEHKWLQRLVGEWTCESECIMGPDQPPMKSSGVESVRSLGGLWTIGEGRGEMPGDGGDVDTIMTLGYDPVKKKFVGSFVASVMTHIWEYNGQLNDEKTILTLDTEGPDFADPTKTVHYQDIIEFIDQDNRTLKSRMPGKDGSWIEFMSARYTRKK